MIASRTHCRCRCLWKSSESTALIDQWKDEKRSESPSKAAAIDIIAMRGPISYHRNALEELPMGLFTQKPKLYAPPQSALPPTMLGQTLAEERAPVPGGRTAVLADLPGRPGSYLDSEFAPKVDAFVRYAREAGHDLSFTSAYRTQEGQDDLRKTGQGRMPAKDSLHSAGLAVDIGDFDGFPESKKLAVRKAAERAGLSWGGTFGDTIHFFLDPGQDRRELIDNFTGQVQRLQRGR